MAISSVRTLNMDGSDDPGYRYTMPRLEVKTEGSSKMRKTVLVNLSDVSRSIGRPTEHLLTFLGHRVSAATKIERETGKAYVTGVFPAEDLQEHVLKFIREVVLCRHCRNPETTCHLEGQKKRQVMYLTCKACSRRTDLDPTDRFVKFMMLHMPPPDTTGNAASGPARDASLASQSSGKHQCPQCGHSTTKTTCSKCGTCLRVAEGAIEDACGAAHKSKRSCPTCGHKTTKPSCTRCGSSLTTSVAEAPTDRSVRREEHGELHGDSAESADIAVAQWMVEQRDEGSKDCGLDCWLQSRCVHSVSALDQLRAAMKVLTANASATLDPHILQSQPVVVAEHAKLILGKWHPLLNQLFSVVGDSSAATKVAVATVQEVTSATLGGVQGEDIAMLGIIMALRDLMEYVTDQELVAACEQLPSRSRAMDKFIEFLQDGASDDDREDD